MDDVNVNYLRPERRGELGNKCVAAVVMDGQRTGAPVPSLPLLERVAILENRMLAMEQSANTFAEIVVARLQKLEATLGL